MSPKAFLTIAILCFCTSSLSAAVTSSTEAAPKKNSYKSYTIKDLENLAGRKLSFSEKFQFFMAKGQLKKQSKAGIFPERDELTEGFRPLAFFGTLLSGGILYLIMLFTERDSNALRWAQWGFWGVTLVLAGLVLAYNISQTGL